MSHLKERKEKNCLNCNAQVAGRYCNICGQENIEPKESVIHLVNHFFQDVTHFDGKFFSTLWLLMVRPGFLSKEYVNGRRASYLNPIRMYVFTSAIFFLIFFTMIGSKTKKTEEQEKYNATAFTEKLKLRLEAINTAISFTGDSGAAMKMKAQIASLQQQINIIKKDSMGGEKFFTEQQGEDGFINFTNDKYSSLKSYDSIQKTLPEKARDNFIERKLIYKSMEVKEKYKKDKGAVKEKLIENFFHKFPQIMFLSLPVFALILQLLYIRRKDFFYVNHLIFTVHLYIFTFIALIFLFLFQKLDEQTHWGIFALLEVFLSIAIVFYQYKSLRNFYQQRRAKTIVKFFILNFLSLLFMVILFSIFFLFSFFQI